ncbi:integrase core domain-containing protein [Sediminitomix flava]|uniref:Integrase-like protein n=1 Tax=Sediminitomix flava TaxID=379075 RepID=A0A315YY52_SEDFL|nr:integrase core domain-containing protein [Sediminitomix flava]PWJ34987.1 integrase-like protein [Sediminitomix flava]
MNRKGNCWDNSVAESFFKSIKYEYLYRFKFQSMKELRIEVSKYIYWYNHKRLHSTLGYKTPVERENELNFINLKRIA